MNYRKSVTDGMIDYFLSYKDITAFEYLKVLQNHANCLPSSREKMGKASNSEIRRWLEKGSVVINGIKVMVDEVIDFPITELILFKGSKSQCSIL